MNYALVGYGKMGRAVDEAARARGHKRAAVVDRSARGAARSIGGAGWRGVSVAFEFTEPAAARDHVIALLRRGVSVVCGTTGWDAGDAAVERAARGTRAGLIVAANFSVGMNLFYEAVEAASRRYLAAGGYDPWVAEWHHRAKRDAPSGTARRLRAIVGGDVPVAAVRAGPEPGRHLVGFDGPHDAVVLSHEARSRAGFAEGAVIAAEWLAGRKGVHGFDEVLDHLVRKKRGGRR
jgi:4-hydroxy-tetrahydrodipicolinate reductase